MFLTCRCQEHVLFPNLSVLFAILELNAFMPTSTPFLNKVFCPKFAISLAMFPIKLSQVSAFCAVGVGGIVKLNFFGSSSVRLTLFVLLSCSRVDFAYLISRTWLGAMFGLGR